MRLKKTLPIVSAFFMFISAARLTADSSGEKEKAAQFNQKGIEALNKNEYTQAIDYFKQSLEIMPDNDTIKKNLAVAHNNYAIYLNEQGKRQDAKESLYEAIEMEKDNAAYKDNLANIISALASEYYKNGNYELAIREIKESLALKPRHIPGLILLGQIYYQTQELESAEKTWKKAYSYAPKNKELKRMLTKLKDEKKIETELKKLDAYYFDIRFDKETVESEVYDIKYYLQEAYRDIGRDFDYFPRHKIPVILYAQKDFHQLRETPEWVAGLYDGKIRLPIRKDSMSEKDFKRLIWHEYTHAVVFNLTDGKCPIWFNEGLAKHEEAKIETPDTTALSNAVKNNSIIPLSKLNSSFSLRTNPNQLNLAYLESYSFIEFMLDRWTFHVIKDILSMLKRGKSLDEAFFEETNRNIFKLNNDWKDYIKRTYCK